MGKEILDKIDKYLKEGSDGAYQKFFKGMLKKWGVKSPAELDNEKKKKFFAEIEKGWTKEKN